MVGDRASGREAKSALQRRLACGSTPGTPPDRARPPRACARVRGRPAPTSVGYSRRSIIAQVGLSATTLRARRRRAARARRGCAARAGAARAGRRTPRPACRSTRGPARSGRRRRCARSTSTVSRPISGSLFCDVAGLEQHHLAARARPWSAPASTAQRSKVRGANVGQQLVAVDARASSRSSTRCARVAVQHGWRARHRAAPPCPAASGFASTRSRSVRPARARAAAPCGGGRAWGSRRRTGGRRAACTGSCTSHSLHWKQSSMTRSVSAPVSARTSPSCWSSAIANSFGNASQYLKHMRQPAQTSNTRAVSRCSAASSQ